MNELDREIEAALRRRAERVRSHPLGFGDVSRRIVRRRRRTASMATAAVALPALVGIGWAVTRPEPVGTAVGSPDGAPPTTDALSTTTVDATTGMPATWRCEGPAPVTTLPGDTWSYFAYCEAMYGSAMTTIVPMPTTTTVSVTELAALLDQVVFLDASGSTGTAVLDTLTAQLGVTPPHVAHATRTAEQTMAMPTGADVAVGYEMLSLLGIGGFDTWSPDLIDGALPDGISVVIVIGEDWSDRSSPPQTTIVCPSANSELPATTTTSLLDAAGVPMTTLVAGSGVCP